MKHINDRMKQNILIGVISGTILLLVFFLFFNFSLIGKELNRFINVLMPFISGFAIAFVLSPLVVFVEKILPKRYSDKCKRMIGVLFAMIMFFTFFVVFSIIMIPQLADSISALATTINSYFKSGDDIFVQLVNTFGLTEETLSTFADVFNSVLGFIVTYFTNILPDIIDGSLNFVVRTFNVVVGVVIAVYILLDRDRFYLQIKKVMYALFPQKKVDYVIDVSHLSSHLFKRFILGKLLDSFIIGILCFVGMSIIGIEYPLLISCIIGVTNMIPVFGPFIGAVPAIFILLLVSPIQALWFAIFVFVLQQFDGNILGPYILGDSMGLPSFWIMFAIIVGGGFFGIIGMFLGVPLFALIYFLIKTAVAKRLEQREIVL